MKVSEKSLELNVAAELLLWLRYFWGMQKTYLRGLTQREESQEGVDFFVQLDPATRLFAYQFKAPKGKVDAVPYRYTLRKEQHELLFSLSQLAPSSVFYVLPFYVAPAKLQQKIPDLLEDTWFLDVRQAPTEQLFGTLQTKKLRCWASFAQANPEYKLLSFHDLPRLEPSGIPVQSFSKWYASWRQQHSELVMRRRNPWTVRGLRVAIVAP
jgi:hypothetical protein